MLVNLNELYKNNTGAVAQLNVNNLEWTKYILEVANELESPIILGVSEGAKRYMGGYNTVVNIVKGLIKDLNINIPVAIHLDHGSSIESCKEAIDAGFTSVMIDASKKSLEENISITNEVIAYAHAKGVTVEAELGGIGGSEDDVTAGIKFAEIDNCIKFVNETKVDYLAPALGSVHGFYKGEPDIQFEDMKKINELTNTPLVLHGASGISDQDIKKAIERGTVKININTELQVAWSKAVRNFIIENDSYDPRKVIGSGEQALKEVAKNKIILFQNK